MYTKNSHRRYTALALSLANLQSAQDAHTYRLPSGRAAPRNSHLVCPLPPIPTSNATPSLSPGTLPSPKHRPRASPRASSLTRPDRTSPALNTSPKEITHRLHTDHTIWHTGRFKERARGLLFFSELVPGAALMAAMIRSRRVCSTTMAIPHAGWVALPALCNGQLLLQFIDLCPQVPLLTPRTLLRP